MQRLSSLVGVLSLLALACGGSEPAAADPEPLASTGSNDPVEVEPVTEEPAAPPTPDDPAFESGDVRCLHVAPEGELLSCEEISMAGKDEPSAVANCRMLGGNLEPGACPTENVVGRCQTMDGPDLEPVYPIRITHYESTQVPDAAKSAELCEMLNGTVISLP